MLELRKMRTVHMNMKIIGIGTRQPVKCHVNQLCLMLELRIICKLDVKKSTICSNCYLLLLFQL